ncbi:MAG: hypothetical protein K5898_03685 [Ruminococcus sp.]|uniref:hypothetical protein n=1 Tax=Ruminococcus sp. TaxID=41978 RepID=UPI0025F02CBE|nr:hypothetical protein [Ruminococcus sp.]MCR4794269.1 hypothetical protein [Ruminococcus sp.]
MYTIRSKNFIKFKNPEKTISVIRAEIDCDSVSDLPAVDDISGCELAQGSIAWVINDARFYGLNSEGQWCVQTGGSNNE